MTSFLLDSTVHIHWGRGRIPVVRWLETNAGEDLVASAVTIAEVFSGAKPEVEPRWDAYFEHFRIATVDGGAARLAGVMRFALARQGRQLAVADALIAAQALINGWTVVTANARDFAQTGVPLVELG